MKTYDELQTFKTFRERFDYLKLQGKMGVATFGVDRELNQQFYKSDLWQSVRNEVIFRDHGKDLGLEEIGGVIIIHHMNPITVLQLTRFDPSVIDPNQLISVSLRTHNAIHFCKNIEIWEERKPGDTKLW